VASRLLEYLCRPEIRRLEYKPRDLMEVSGQTHAPAALFPGNCCPYLLNRKQGGPRACLDIAEEI
jgi:hypothetical protein